MNDLLTRRSIRWQVPAGLNPAAAIGMPRDAHRVALDARVAVSAQARPSSALVAAGPGGPERRHRVCPDKHSACNSRVIIESVWGDGEMIELLPWLFPAQAGRLATACVAVRFLRPA